MAIPFPQTAESIQRAKLAQAQEREQVHQQTGIPVLVIRCEACGYLVDGMGPGLAERAMARHIVAVHHSHKRRA